MLKRNHISIFLLFAFVVIGLHNLVPHHHHHGKDLLATNQHDEDNGKDHNDIKGLLSLLHHSGDTLSFIQLDQESKNLFVKCFSKAIIQYVSFALYKGNEPPLLFSASSSIIVYNSAIFSPLGLRAPPCL